MTRQASCLPQHSHRTVGQEESPVLVHELLRLGKPVVEVGAPGVLGIGASVCNPRRTLTRTPQYRKLSKGSLLSPKPYYRIGFLALNPTIQLYSILEGAIREAKPLKQLGF